MATQQSRPVSRRCTHSRLVSGLFCGFLALVLLSSQPLFAAPEGQQNRSPTDTLGILAGPSAPDDTKVLYDISQLPPAVAATRQALIDAARTGDLETIKPIFDAASEPPMLAFDAVEDPVTYLRLVSGDREGTEILAILKEVLEAGFVRRAAGTPDEIYIWPYFYTVPLDTLTPSQKVELFELVTAQDLEEMRFFGAYNFYRVGITASGSWAFFVAGD